MSPLTSDEKRGFVNATDCHICEKPFNPTDVKHRDHCHFTGKYRGAAHEGCNLNYTKSHSIPIVCHNLSGYDSHFLVKELATQFDGGINLLPINKERYISFTKYVKDTKVDLRFIDSFRFMASNEIPRIIIIICANKVKATLEILEREGGISDGDGKLTYFYSAQINFTKVPGCNEYLVKRHDLLLFYLFDA